MGLPATTFKKPLKKHHELSIQYSRIAKRYIHSFFFFYSEKKEENNLFSIRYSFILSFNNSSSCSELIYSLYVLGYFILFYCPLVRPDFFGKIQVVDLNVIGSPVKFIPKHLNILSIRICNNVYHLWRINIPI